MSFTKIFLGKIKRGVVLKQGWIGIRLFLLLTANHNYIILNMKLIIEEKSMELDYHEKLKIESALKYFIDKLKAENCSPDIAEQYEELLERVELS